MKSILSPNIQRLNEVSKTLFTMTISNIPVWKLRTLELQEDSLKKVILSMQAQTSVHAGVQLLLALELAEDLIRRVEILADEKDSINRAAEDLVFDLASVHRAMYSALHVMPGKLPVWIFRRHIDDVSRPFSD